MNTFTRYLAILASIALPCQAAAGPQSFSPAGMDVTYSGLVTSALIPTCTINLTIRHSVDSYSAEVVDLISSCGVTGTGFPWPVTIETPASISSGDATQLRITGVNAGNSLGRCFGTVVVNWDNAAGGLMTVPYMTMSGTVLGMPRVCSVIGFSMSPDRAVDIRRL